MTGRSRLLVRWVGMATASLGLLIAARRSVPVPPFWHPGRMPGWWRQCGPVVAAFGVLRALLLLASCYLTALWTVALVSWHLPHAGWVGFARRARLPGARLVARSGAGTDRGRGGVGCGARGQPCRRDYSRPADHRRSERGREPSARTALPGAGSGPSPGPGAGPRARRWSRPPTAPFVGACHHRRAPTAPCCPRATPRLCQDPARPRTAPPSGGEATTPATGPGGETAAGAPTAGAPTVRAPNHRPPTAGPSTSPAAGPPSTRPSTSPPTMGPPTAGPPTAGPRTAGPPTAGPPTAGPPATSPPTTAAVRRAGRAPASGAGEHRARSWMVRPGDSLWTIAATALTAASGRPPSARELGTYWWQVVEPQPPPPAESVRSGPALPRRRSEPASCAWRAAAGLRGEGAGRSGPARATLAWCAVPWSDPPNEPVVEAGLHRVGAARVAGRRVRARLFGQRSCSYGLGRRRAAGGALPLVSLAWPWVSLSCSGWRSAARGCAQSAVRPRRRRRFTVCP